MDSQGYIHVWPSMPSSHACMPLFTTWYALIPGIILPLRGGIRPYAPPQAWEEYWDTRSDVSAATTASRDSGRVPRRSHDRRVV